MLRIRYVQVVRARNGAAYLYFRRPGHPRSPLPSDPNSAAFRAEYDRLLGLTALRPTPSAGTFDAVALAYLESDLFKRLSPRSQADYRRHIEAVRARFGHLPVAKMSRAFVAAYRDAMLDTPRLAGYRIAVLRRVLQSAVNAGLIPTNPAAKPETRTSPPRHQVWRPEDEQAFLAACGPQLRLAYLLAAYTAQRQGDLLRMTWAQYDGSSITVMQRKTGVRLSVPVHRTLKEALDAAPKRATVILTTPAGRPWKEDHFRHAWREATLAAGLDGLQQRDLRRTAMVRLAEAGATIPEIAAVSGHSIERAQRILETYLPRTAKMAKAAITKLERAGKTRRNKNGTST